MIAHNQKIKKVLPCREQTGAYISRVSCISQVLMKTPLALPDEAKHPFAANAWHASPLGRLPSFFKALAAFP